jgi:hypothetical protein
LRLAVERENDLPKSQANVEHVPIYRCQKTGMTHPRAHFATILLGVFLAANCFALDDVPRRPEFDRYAAMMKKSPFAVATAVVNVEKPNFAKDLYVANAAKLSDGDMITVQSAVDRNLKEYLNTNGPNEHGFSIISIDWSERPAETKATISKDGQVATIGFNQALMSQAPQPMPPPSAPGQPLVPTPAYVPPRPNMTGTVPTPVPRTRTPIQRNPGQSGRTGASP